MAIAIATFAAFGFALVESSLVHTDDGCALEMHCFACRWAMGSTASAARPPAPLPADQKPAGTIVALDPQRRELATGHEARTRGPPRG